MNCEAYAVRQRPMRVQRGQSTGFEVTCARCSLKSKCLPAALTPAELDAAERSVLTRRRIGRGEALYRAGDAFESIYAVRVGFLTSIVNTSGGHTQVLGFQMAGDLVGFDGLDTGLHTCDVVALEDSDVCVIPYRGLAEAATATPALRARIPQLLGQEIEREQAMLQILSTMRSDARVASFLLDISRRLGARGLSRSEFVLKMTRGDIGSLLGITIETVSRIMTRFARLGHIHIDGRNVHILDLDALTRMVASRATARRAPLTVVVKQAA